MTVCAGTVPLSLQLPGNRPNCDNAPERTQWSPRRHHAGVYFKVRRSVVLFLGYIAMAPPWWHASQLRKTAVMRTRALPSLNRRLLRIYPSTHCLLCLQDYLWVMGGRAREFVDLPEERSIGGIIGR
jgi:hypothetical protein